MQHKAGALPFSRDCIDGIFSFTIDTLTNSSTKNCNSNKQTQYKRVTSNETQKTINIVIFIDKSIRVGQ